MDVHFSVSRHWIDISEIEEEEIALFIYDNGWALIVMLQKEWLINY